MNPAPEAGAYNGGTRVLPNPSLNPYTGADIGRLVPAADTRAWYQTQYGCLKDDPTLIARFHTFPDAILPRGVPQTAAPAMNSCLNYATAWPVEEVGAADMVDAERNHPQFAFSPGGPGTVYQIEVESQLRRLDQPLTNCQAVLAADAPLYRNTVAPPAPQNVPVGVQNAANPIAAIVQPGENPCREAADAMASAMSGRWLNNPTRQDTARFAKPFAPPGIGTGEPRGLAATSRATPYFA